ncbi:hypothetical protein [Thaumasiovibrio sp. DFM-14]|uniref:hypothetical protein n=1 Tax=Thaumasiovibrio sp. DFM-14 TaxID=3384792 RepID=UPI00399FE5BF
MKKRSIFYNLAAIFLYTAILGSLYQVMNGYNRVEKQLMDAIARIDGQLSSIEQHLYQLDVVEGCSKQEVILLDQEVFRHESIRALAIGDPDDLDGFFCTNFGSFKNRLNETFFTSVFQGELVLALSQYPNRYHDRSLMFGINVGGNYLIAIINPEIVLGWWIEPLKTDVNVSWALKGESSVLLTRLGEANTVPTIMLGQKHQIEVTQESAQYPYQLVAAMPVAKVWWDVIQFMQRLVIVSFFFVILMSVLIAVLVRKQHKDKNED